MNKQLTPKTLSGFGSLPPEMIVEIFNRINPQKRKAVRTICHKWNTVFGETYRTSLRLNDQNWSRLLKTNIRKLDVVFYELSYRIDSMPISRSFCFKIRKLEIRGTTLCPNFILVFKNCLALEELFLNSIELQKQHTLTRGLGSIYDQLNQNPEELQTWLPKLQRLKIRTRTEEEEEILKLLLQVVRNKKLIEFWLTTSATIGNFNFLPWFGTTELSLSFVYQDVVREMLASCQSSLTNVIVERQTITVDLSSAYEQQKCVGIWTYPRSPSAPKPLVKNLEAMDIFFAPDQILKSPWNQTIFQIQYLKVLRLSFQDEAQFQPLVQSFTTEIVQKCFATLNFVTLQLRVSEPHGPVWNLSIFSKCTSLGTLELWHHQLRYASVVYTSGTFHSVSAIESLPSSLRTFRTSFTIQSTCPELHDLKLKNLRNLETLELITTPWFLLNGIPLKTMGKNQFQHLKLSLPKLKTFHLRHEKYNRLMPDGTWKSVDNVSERLRKKFDANLTRYYINNMYYCSTIDLTSS